MSFGSIRAPWWDDRDVYIVGGGDSLKGRQLERLHEKGRVVGINRAAELITCHCTFTLDHNFTRQRADELRQWAEDGQEVYIAVGSTWFDNVSAIDGVTYLERVPGLGIGDNLSQIINGCNSGYGALCLAILKRARRIWMLGFDLTGDNSHWHDGYPWGCNRSKIYFDRWAKRFDDIAKEVPKGVEVFNCNPDSAIVAFPFSTYDHIGI